MFINIKEIRRNYRLSAAQYEINKLKNAIVLVFRKNHGRAVDEFNFELGVRLVRL